MALITTEKRLLATSRGHSPVAALLNPVAGSRTAIIAEALSNIVWAPIKVVDFIICKLDVGL
jgi:phosphoribosylformylglycinamidine synthase